jgi:hypothetical protein
MKTRNTITKLITITMAVTGLAATGLLCRAGWLQPVEASGRDGSVRFVSYTGIGIVPRQKVRISVGNTANSPGSTVTWTYKVTNTGGVPLYESERIPVPSGEFRSSDISYSGLEVAGEPGTGRVQLMVKLVVELPTGIDPSHAIGSLELIDEETGGTVASIKIQRSGGVGPVATP